MQSERTFHNAPINQHSFRRSQNSASAFAFVLILLLAYLYAIAYDGIFFYFFILFGIIVLSSAMIDIELGLCFVPVVLANPIALVETGTNLILSEYVLLIVMGAYFVQSWTQGAVYKYSRSLLYPSLAMIFAAIFSLSNATFIVAGLQQIVRYFEVMIVLFFLIVNVCTTIRSIRRMVLSFICGGLIAAVVGIAQFITESISSGRSERVYGMLGGGYGAVMSVTVLLCIAILIYGDERWGKTLAMITVPLAGSALLLSQTRAWIGALILSALYGLTLINRQVRRKTMIIFGLIVAIIILVLTTDLFGLVSHEVILSAVFNAFRFGRRAGEYSTEDVSSYYRYVVWTYAINQFLQHPLAGIGVANLRFSSYLPVHLTAPAGPAGYVDNQYVHMFAESGIVGGVAWILFLFRSLRISRRNFIHATDKSIKSYSFGIHVSLLIFSIGGGFWVITPSHELFALMIVLVALSACINTINSNSGGGSSEVALA